MTKAELIERIARSRNLPPDITKKDIAAILGIAFEELANYFAKAKVTRSTSPRFTFPRFGTFTKKKRPARRGVNPRTLEPMQIDASCTVDFKASKELRDQMNGAVAKAGKTTKASRRSGASATAQAMATAKTTRTTARTTAKTTAKTTANKTRGSKPSSSKSVSRASVAPKKRNTKVAAAKLAKVAPSGRLLTPRDEDAELDALIDDESLFVELPATRLKRVRPGQSTGPAGKPGSTETG